MKHLIISLHDLHPGTLTQVMDQRARLLSAGVDRCSILAVPRYHHRTRILDSPETIAWTTQAQLRGDEIVLHGYYHDREGQTDTIWNFFWTRFYTNQEAEFLDLHEMKARERIERGRAVFEKCGWQPHGFIAPAWLMAGHIPESLKELGFSYTSTLGGILIFKPTMEFIPTQSLCWSARSVWRRAASLLWNPWLYFRQSSQPVLRISLHPRDFEYPSLRRQILRFVKKALDAGYTPTTYAAYAAR